MGYTPPFLSVLTSGDILIPSSLDAASSAASLAKSCIIFLNSLFISPHHPVQRGITRPFKNLFCTCWNGQTISAFPSPTTSAAQSVSSFLNFRLYDCVLSLAWRSGGLIVSLLCLYRVLQAVKVLTSKNSSMREWLLSHHLHTDRPITTSHGQQQRLT